MRSLRPALDPAITLATHAGDRAVRTASNTSRRTSSSASPPRVEPPLLPAFRTVTVGLVPRVTGSFARAAAASRARGARHMALPWLGAGLWMMGCRGSARAIPHARFRRRMPRRRLPRPPARPPVTTGTPKPGEAGRGFPPFEEIADGPCEGRPPHTSVVDAEDATFLVSATQARRCQPGRPELEEVAGLPSPRGSAQGFLLHVHPRRQTAGPTKTTCRRTRRTFLGYFLLDPRTHAFSRQWNQDGSSSPPCSGDYPQALPVETGTWSSPSHTGRRGPMTPATACGRGWLGSADGVQRRERGRHSRAGPTSSSTTRSSPRTG